MRLGTMAAAAVLVIAGGGSVTPPASAATRSSVMKPGQQLRPGASRRSPNGRYRLVMQRDGNLVLLRGRRRVLWSAQTGGNRGARAVLERTGDLVVRSRSRSVLYATGTDGAGRTRLVVTNRGDAVLTHGRRRLWSALADVYRLGSNQSLRSGQSRSSANGRYQLAMNGGGNLVLYDHDRRLPIWNSQTAVPGAYATMQRDGNLVVFAPSGEVRYASATPGNPGAHLNLQDDGNAVIFTPANKPVWSSDVDVSRLGSGQLLRGGQYRRSPDGRYQLGMYPTGNLVLDDLDMRRALWSAQTDGHPGAYASMQGDGNLVVYAPDGQVLYATATTAAGAYVTVDRGAAVMLNGAGAQLWSTDTDNSRLTSNQLLRPNQSRQSPSGRYQLSMWTNGNLVLWDHQANQPVWASGTSGHPGAFAAMGADGNLVVLASIGTPPLFQTATHGDAGTHVEVRDSGDVVVVSGAGVPLWSTKG
jgi:hypothetical protein